jgi:hypothetical protein
LSLADVARALSADLAARRHAAGLTQPQLATITGMSVTSIGHAETGRLWQSRDFWQLADKALHAEGALLTLHDAYRAAAAGADSITAREETKTKTTADPAPVVAIAAPVPVAAVTITWADGTVTTVRPPETTARPVDTAPGNLLFGESSRVPPVRGEEHG